MQDSLPAGGLRLCRAGVEPAGSLREVSAHVILLSRAFAWRDNRSDRPWNRPARGCVRCVQTTEPCPLRALTTSVWPPEHGLLEQLRPGHLSRYELPDSPGAASVIGPIPPCPSTPIPGSERTRTDAIGPRPDERPGAIPRPTSFLCKPLEFSSNLPRFKSSYLSDL